MTCFGVTRRNAPIARTRRPNGMLLWAGYSTSISALPIWRTGASPQSRQLPLPSMTANPVEVCNPRGHTAVVCGSTEMDTLAVRVEISMYQQIASVA
ncbi:MAG: hypothetical protein QOE71_2484 [Pseudonocardiales bacterium]|nr:hypothetical protein [Pseudonocardiales bacterium]MDQ1751428.1 hypothetical protein [Pseudonocardiales bacterium]